MNVFGFVLNMFFHLAKKKKMDPQKQINREISECEKHYDKDDFKGGLLIANNAIKSHPKCGELIGWHALFLEKTKQHDEAAVEIKKALMADMNNAKVWKLSGMVHKEQGNYLQALQSFTMSYNKNNQDQQVVNDICSIHMHLQNYSQYLDFARKLFKLNQMNSNFMRIVIGLFLTGNLQASENYLEAFESKLAPPSSNEERLFYSELGRFHATNLIRLGEYQKCLDYLERQAIINDRISVLEDKAQCYLHLKNQEELMKTLNMLFAEYPDNGDYFQILESTLDKDKYIEELFRIKDEFKSKYAHVRILELMDINDSRFVPLLKEHLSPLLKKGSPAIYATIADFSQEKLDLAVKLAFEEDIPVSSYAIRQIFYAQVLHFEKKYDEALVEIEKGIKHTPTIVELYVTKVQILSKMGRSSEALECATTLSQLDPADRNSNNTYVRMLYRNGYMKEARLAAEPFSIDQKKKPKFFRTEFNKAHFRAARCALRGGDVEDALHFYQDCVSHFDEYKNGMVSYFSWGVRRPQTIIDMIEWEQTLVNHKQLGKAFANVARIFIQRGQLKEIRPEALKLLTSKNPEACAYVCVIFALLNEPLKALKAFLKLQGHWKFVAMPAMQQLAEETQKAEGYHKDIFFELYKPEEIEAQSAVDHISKARGLLYAKKDTELVKKELLSAAEKVDEYRVAIDIILTSKVEMQDENYSKDLIAKIHEKHPLYEVEFKNGFSADEPHEHSVKREK